MPEQINCTLVRTEKLNEFAYSFLLEAEGLAARLHCGQFVAVRCGEGRLLRRPISVCSWQEGEGSDLLRLVFEVRGAGTRWLAGRKAGQTVDILAPLGHGFDLPEGDILLVGGGIGVPPLLACAQRAAGRASAVLAFRDAARAMLCDEFEVVCRAVTVATDDGSLGRRGLAGGAVRDLLSRGQKWSGILACGPRPMLRAVASVAKEFGIPCQVSMEERMGCGVGACLVCACAAADGTYRHVCKDGPVFRAEEVLWDE